MALGKFFKIQEGCESMIGELAAFGAAICWTVSAILYREAVLHTKPISANIMRCVCTSLILVASLAVIGRLQVFTSLSAYAVVLAGASGVIGLGLGDTLYMVSLKLIGVARAVPITCTYPLFNLLLAVFLQGETVTVQVVFGAVAIVFGIWLLTGEGEKIEKGLQKENLVKGVVLALVTAIVWAVSITMIDMAVTLPETGTLDGALAVNTLRVSAVAAFLLASAPISDRQFSFLKMPKRTIATLISGGVVALALGWFFLAYSFLHIPEAQAVPISSTSPLFAAVAGIVLLHEPVTAKNIAGSIIIVLGVFLLFII
jgi:DME family drug/metabolite transporter